ncbi:hypothetical protein ARMGADRAFT_1048603 [Armillaria gallica]|uniref:Uncharacterized protein n=1 Tax=Armillaria gallica TaxID=47427 RepID=A0A2H3D2W3_ARMGA|nr:hypothetical protein ARMGADRAFT_1048603 [Armillaria gallica]
MPIKIDVFEKNLATHPNQAFVQSIITTLKEGFWPWADTHHNEDYLLTWDNGRMSLQSEMEQKFICRYRDEEVTVRHFSQLFGPDLLLGMYSTPVHAVPKPHTEDFRMVSNMSAGIYAPNCMIHHSDIAGLHLDGLHMLFSAILSNTQKTLVVFKSDVSKAYRLCPMHPLWQLKQVVTTGYLTSQKAAGEVEVLVRTINCNNNFSECGSGHVWYSINGLITWIAINIEGIEDLGCYVDDNFGFDEWNDLDFYEPYDKFYPCKQTKLLRLKPKQLHGLELIWANWSFNIFPLLKPGLCNIYAKMQGKMNAFTGITLSNAVKEDLTWLADHIEGLYRVCCYDSMDWDLIVDMTITILCDACLDGMGFWIPKIVCGFVCPMPDLPEEEEVIFFFEALYNTNTVNIFNSLRALPNYNPILKLAVNKMISHDIDLHVLHISGLENDVADALSHSQFSKAQNLVLQLIILPFKPPCNVLGASKC